MFPMQIEPAYYSNHAAFELRLSKPKFGQAVALWPELQALGPWFAHFSEARQHESDYQI